MVLQHKAKCRVMWWPSDEYRCAIVQLLEACFQSTHSRLLFQVILFECSCDSFATLLMPGFLWRWCWATCVYQFSACFLSIAILYTVWRSCVCFPYAFFGVHTCAFPSLPNPLLFFLLQNVRESTVMSDLHQCLSIVSHFLVHNPL